MVTRYQPQGGARLSQQSTAARKVTAAFALGGSFRSAINQKLAPVVAAGPTFASYPGGMYALGNGSGSINTGILPANLGMAGASPREIVVRFYMSDTNTARCVFSFGDTSGSTHSQFTLLTNNDYRTVQLTTYGEDVSYNVYSTGGTGALVTLSLAYDGARGITFTSWAKLDSTGQVIKNSMTYTLSSPLAIGNTVPLYLMGGGTYPGAWSSMNTGLYFASFFGGSTLTPVERQALIDNCWSLFDEGSSRSAYQSEIASSNSASPTTATVTGVQGSSGTGSTSASGGAAASVTGVGASGRSGTATAAGSGTAIVSSVAATTDAGMMTASGAGVASTSGVQSSSTTGAAIASGGGSTAINGNQASASTGSTSAAGAGNAAATGNQASGQVGTVSATAGGNVSVAVTGVSASSAVGMTSAMGAAVTSVSGAQSNAQVGSVIATAGGNVNVSVAGVAASALTGIASGSGSSTTAVAGIQVPGLVGVVAGAGGARVVLTGLIGTSQVGMVTANGGVNPNANVTLFGVSSSASVGTAYAYGTSSQILPNITEDMLCKVVRNYIQSINNTMRVVRTPVNLASMPNGPYVSFTPGLRTPLSTTTGNYAGLSRTVGRHEEMRFQIDCYGDGARDLSESLSALFRDQYAIDQFAQSGLDVAPLYASDVMQMPFVNDSNQYEERYTFEIHIQVNSTIITPQQSATMLNINILSIDATFPPA